MIIRHERAPSALNDAQGTPNLRIRRGQKRQQGWERPDAHNLQDAVREKHVLRRYAIGIINARHAWRATGPPPSPAKFERKV